MFENGSIFDIKINNVNNNNKPASPNGLINAQVSTQGGKNGRPAHQISKNSSAHALGWGSSAGFSAALNNNFMAGNGIFNAHAPAHVSAHSAAYGGPAINTSMAKHVNAHANHGGSMAGFSANSIGTSMAAHVNAHVNQGGMMAGFSETAINNSLTRHVNAHVNSNGFMAGNTNTHVTANSCGSVAVFPNTPMGNSMAGNTNAHVTSNSGASVAVFPNTPLSNSKKLSLSNSMAGISNAHVAANNLMAGFSGISMGSSMSNSMGASVAGNSNAHVTSHSNSNSSLVASLNNPSSSCTPMGRRRASINEFFNNLSLLNNANYNDIDREKLQNDIINLLQSRPDRQELVNRGILSVQDYEKTLMIKKYISEHLVSRPGPLDVYHHLVNSEDIAKRNQRELLTAYQRAKTLLMCKTGALSETNPQVTDNLQKRRIMRSIPKTKNITFHEFVPGKSGAKGNFIRRKWPGLKDNINSFSYLNHYRQLIEQQALFLQMELSEKQKLSMDFNEDLASAMEKSSIFSDTQSFFNQNMNDQHNSLSSEFLRNNFEMLNDLNDLKNYGMNSNNNYDKQFKLEDDYFEDFSSSGYGTSIHANESFDFDDSFNHGYGLFHDNQHFNNVYDKIAHYEKLQSRNFRS